MVKVKELCQRKGVWRIFRGENTISRRTLTPNPIGWIPENGKGFSQWERVCVVASIFHGGHTPSLGDGEGKLLDVQTALEQGGRVATGKEAKQTQH